jgi:uncharacterized protein YukE/pimeloyl-ACP methyl ester carboxylesterase
MSVPNGTIPYPPNIDPAAIDRFAATLSDIAGRLDDASGRLDIIAADVQACWRGEAATSFSDHAADRSHAITLGRAQFGRAIETLTGYADALRRNQDQYATLVEREQFLRRLPVTPPDVMLLITYQQRLTVDAIQHIGQQYSSELAPILTRLDDIAERSFIPVGERMDQSTVSDQSRGRDLIADALEATEDYTTDADGNKIAEIDTDEIQVRKLSDGSYVVVLPGVTDLSNAVTDPSTLVGGNDDDTARKVWNAKDSALRERQNRYAEMVKVALQRAGVPPGSDVTIVGHSYGAYTAVDLANDDAFNSADGTSTGYHVRVKRVVAVAADTDWKLKRTPTETDVVIFNSRDDSVYQAEAQADPEKDWLWRSDRPLKPRVIPGVPIVIPAPLPVPKPLRSPIEALMPRTTRPTGRANQIEVEVDAGRQLNMDDKWSGHHPRNYSRAMRSPRLDPTMAEILDKSGDAVVVEKFNVRVPDRVPRVPLR